MCGIFGYIAKYSIRPKELKTLAFHARQRGQDSSGLVFDTSSGYEVRRADWDIKKLFSEVKMPEAQLVLGHSRLITNGLHDNQPVVRDGIALLHNGIITNVKNVWDNVSVERRFEIDSEAIIGVALEKLENGTNFDDLAQDIFNLCKGSISAALIAPSRGKILLFSNNGSLFYGYKGTTVLFASERYPLALCNCSGIQQLVNKGIVFDIPVRQKIEVQDFKNRVQNLIPSLNKNVGESSKLIYRKHDLTRCTRCILPETMPFIVFDDKGVCNYCHSYKIRNKPKPKREIFRLVEGYRRQGLPDCIVPFSGGRDSCWGLHLICKELGMKPITYTYDWGMVTDLGRRNISRMCAALGVENIVVAADIEQKRKNIAMNLRAWLNNPHLGMISILTAGDKHFFRYINRIKRQTGIQLNLWGINPLEVTHFKAGFLGVSPDFDGEKVYMHGLAKQLNYQRLRLYAMAKSPRYFNYSLWDTISGEYFRSFTEKSDYFHVFDFWRWDESECNKTLQEYDWELAPDTKTTWRIGDGTAAFYNYIYYNVAGFSEHDTFRSNQIREGQLSRDVALDLVADENRPRYENIKWYLDVLGMNFAEVIDTVNAIKPLLQAKQ